jgi:ribonuclease inhibitor
VRVFILNGRLLISESHFWQQYVDVVQPEGAEFFGRNLDAFRDAVTGGGPGWPGGPCVFRIVEAELALNHLGRDFLESLCKIAQETHDIRVELA